MHHWLVKRGHLTVQADSESVLIDIDTQGAPACLLTIQDTGELGAIVAEYAREVWESEAEHAAYEQVVEQPSELFYRWPLPGGELSVFLDETSEFLQLGYTGTGRLALSVGCAVELSQVLSHFAEAGMESLRE